jgi:predicted nucleotide-binding protein (sugar kinase/HSP70/actin superfamily)
MVTRIEAYLDRMRTATTTRPRPPARPTPPVTRFDGGPVYIPYVADHVHAIAGALRSIGVEAEVLPPPDAESVAAGEALATGKECHVYSIMAGDMLRAVERIGPGRTGSYFFFGATAPCLLTQFGPGYRQLLAERGVDNVRVVAPPLEEFIKVLGMGGLLQMWRGLVVIDLLHKWQCQTRPYEARPGSTDAVHAENVRDVTESLALDDLDGFVDRALRRIAGVATDRSVPRPLVGVAGDIYTRINAAGNMGLFRTLEELGCEVWPASFLVEIVDFGLTNDLIRRLKEGTYPQALGALALVLRRDLAGWRARRRLAPHVRHAAEPSHSDIVDLTAPYVGSRAIQQLLLDVGKMVDFASHGVDGVAQAICLNCMIGTAAAALLGRIRRDYGVPMVSLVYGSTEGPAQRTKLEAFVHQVREHHRKRQPKLEG